MKKEIIYFAHPIKSYHTNDEGHILRHLRTMYPNATIINPATTNNVGTFENCHQCMQEHMIPIFFRYIKECTIFAIWKERDSCGIRCELNKAWELDKKIIQLSIEVKEMNIGLQEYHYA